MDRIQRKELLEKTLQFQNHGRILVDVLISLPQYRRMLDHLNVQTETELLDALGSDFFYVPGRDISQNEGYLPYYKNALYMDEKTRVCPLGIRWQRKSYDSKFSVDEALDGPFQRDDVTVEDILKHPWPTAKDFDFSGMVGACEEAGERLTIGGLWTGIMGDSYRMMGFQNFLCNAAMDPELVQTLIDRMTEMYLSLNDAIFAQLKGKLDIWFFGNDFGAQNGLLLSPTMIEDYFYHNIKALCALAHQYDVRVMMHSCGGIVPIIPMLAEAGVEILDPIQVTAKGMDPDSIADSCGGKIVFHGGIDTQQVLPTGTPEQVAAHAQRVTDALGATGGYIFAPSQILDQDVPCENIMAMYDAIRNINQKYEEERT